MLTMKPSAWLRAGIASRAVGVDRKAGVLRGYVVAQEGAFKSEGRGEFDRQSLEGIVRLGNAKGGGLKSHFTHPDMSNDGLGKFLGRSRNFGLSTTTVERDGRPVQIDAVRADLHFDPSASKTPSGDLAGYIMDLAENDPAALSSSLVLKVNKEYRLKPNGTRQQDDNGEDLPPLWRPLALHSSDIVNVGDAVDDLLSAGIDPDGLPLSALWHGAELLDSTFAGQPREVIRERCVAWLDRYLDRRHPPEPMSLAMAQRRLRLRELETTFGSHAG